MRAERLSVGLIIALASAGAITCTASGRGVPKTLRDTTGAVFAYTNIRTEHGHLVRAPIVDPNGYSFVLAGPSGALTIKRRDALRPVACEDDLEDEARTRPPLKESPLCELRLLDRLF